MTSPSRRSKVGADPEHVTQEQLPDKAAMESFFDTLKAEYFHPNRFDINEQLQQGLDQYITTTTNELS